MKSIENLFAGRMNRKSYIKWNLSLIAICVVLGLLLYSVGGASAIWAVLLIAVPVSLYVNARRFHDLGKPAYWAIGIIALDLVNNIYSGTGEHVLNAIGTIIFLYMCFASGDKGDNQYGSAA